MEQVRAAALAPAEPSSQDLKVASEASQKATEARSEIAKAQADNLSAAESSTEQAPTVSVDTASRIETITESEINAGLTPGAAADEVLDIASNSANAISSQGLDANAPDAMQTRIGRIQNAYLQAYTPSSEGISLQA
mmetsp:Transcript_11750/g.15489  ORF Transcript_11750/g.15489 Transcript_11750/m.15489 type:complete len:137 (+) Transcript_11750:887-1297(+)